jgi:hypothetical protein
LKYKKYLKLKICTTELNLKIQYKKITYNLLRATVACGRNNAVTASTKVPKPRARDFFGPQNMERT